MKVILPGGSGHVGAALRRHFGRMGAEVVVLSRRSGAGSVAWDGRTLGEWTKALEGADVVINLAGRTVNCRYNQKNLDEMMQSRVDSARVIGQAIAQCERPPKVWLQSSTATIYSHRFDAPNDERTGILGGDEPGAPYKWNASIAIAKAWEAATMEADLPATRRVLLRSAMTMSPDVGSVFWTLARLTKRGLGGQIGSGRQYVSWIHEADFCRAIDFLMAREDLDGAVNLCAPEPLPQKEFARVLREALGVKIGLPATAFMVEMGTWLMRTESELVLKSRRVVPTRLLEAGFTFDYPDWRSASRDLASRTK